MTGAEFDALLARLADGWARRDYAAVIEAFAPGIHYADPLRYRLEGREALLAFFTDDGGFAQRTAWRLAVFDETRQVGMAEYTYEGTHRYHGVAIVKLAGGRITHWREYQHVDPRDWEELAGSTRFS